jgi:hypothetical protein
MQTFHFMKHQLYFSLLLLLPILIKAQAPAKNVYVELSGPGGFISANYDARLQKSDKGIGLRAGVGTLFDAYSIGYTVPVGVNYLVGKDKKFFEVGAGVSYYHFQVQNQDSWFNFKSGNFLAPYLAVGYRYQARPKGVSFRAGLCQFLYDFNLPAILGVPSLYPTVSLGYSF